MTIHTISWPQTLQPRPGKKPHLILNNEDELSRAKQGLDASIEKYRLALIRESEASNWEWLASLLHLKELLLNLEIQLLENEEAVAKLDEESLLDRVGQLLANRAIRTSGDTE